MAVEYQTILLIVAVVGLIITVITAAVKTTRAVAASEVEIRKDFTLAMQNVKDDHTEKIDAAKRERDEKIDAARREFGEVASAIRQKVQDFETWSRDEFVRKGSFELVVTRIEKGMDALGSRIDQRFDRIMDRMERPQGAPRD